MPEECIFCKIVAGQIPSHGIHDDGHTFAFLDIRPLTRGHTLVIPKRHVARFEELAPADVARLMATVHALTPRVCSAVGAPASTIAINNGKEGGQEVRHVHVHLVPRTKGDGGGPIHALFSSRPTLGADEMKKLAEKIRAAAPTTVR